MTCRWTGGRTSYSQLPSSTWGMGADISWMFSTQMGGERQMAGDWTSHRHYHLRGEEWVSIFHECCSRDGRRASGMDDGLQNSYVLSDGLYGDGRSRPMLWRIITAASVNAKALVAGLKTIVTYIIQVLKLQMLDSNALVWMGCRDNTATQAPTSVVSLIF